MAKHLIDKLISQINSDKVNTLSDKDPFSDNKRGWTHTGSPVLEYNLGILGFPPGLIEIAGKSRSGKTTLAMMSMHYFLKANPNGCAVILSSEKRDNKHYAKSIGMNPEDVVVISFQFVEELFSLVKKLITAYDQVWTEEKIEGSPSFFFIWDSIGATLCKEEFDVVSENINTHQSQVLDKGKESYDQKHSKPGSFAKTAKSFAKYMLGEIYNRSITMLLLNHTMANIGSHGRISGGGEWLQYLPTIRLETKLKEMVSVTSGGDKEEVAQVTEIKVVKNDFGSRRSSRVEILLGYGFVLSEEDIEYAIEKEILEKEGAKKISFMGKISWSYRKDFYQLYKDKSPYIQILHNKIREARHQDVLKEKGL